LQERLESEVAEPPAAALRVAQDRVDRRLPDGLRGGRLRRTRLRRRRLSVRLLLAGLHLLDLGLQRLDLLQQFLLRGLRRRRDRPDPQDAGADA
jgi:hypothetical protein